MRILTPEFEFIAFDAVLETVCHVAPGYLAVYLKLFATYWCPVSESYRVTEHCVTDVVFEVPVVVSVCPVVDGGCGVNAMSLSKGSVVV